MNNGLGTHPSDTEGVVQSLGYIAALMASNPLYRTFPIACLQVWVLPPLAHGQARIFFDEKGGAVGYLTWAFLAEDVADRWINDPKALLHFSEWNEGGDLWIMDFFAVPGFAKIIVDEARRGMFADETYAFSVRKSRGCAVRRRVRWRR